MPFVTWNSSKEYKYWHLSLSETDFEVTEKQFRKGHRITEAINAEKPKLINK